MLVNGDIQYGFRRLVQSGRPTAQLIGRSSQAGTALTDSLLTSEKPVVRTTCAHQVRWIFRNTALDAKSERRAKALPPRLRKPLDLLAGRLSTRSLQITDLCLERAIRYAEVRDLVGRNVTALVKAPAGRAGRPSKGPTPEQAQDLLRAVAGSPCTPRLPAAR